MSGAEDNELLNQVIRHGFLAQNVYAKVSFNKAKDTNDLLIAAQDNADMVVTAIKARVIPYVDELLEKRLRSVIDKSNGKVSIVLGDGKFTVVQVEESN